MRGPISGWLVLVLALLATFAGVNREAQAGTAGPTVATEKIGNGVFVFRYGAYRSVFVVNDAGVIVTDPLNEDAASLYLREIRKITAAPVTHVIYSHSHWDRIAGATIFKKEGAEIIMQKACAANLVEVLARTPLAAPVIVPPDRTFEDLLEINSGGNRVELYDFGPSHDKCLVVMYIPEVNALFMPEMVSSLGASLPIEDITIGSYELSNIVKFFEAVESLAKSKGVETIIIGYARELSMAGSIKSEPATGPVSLLRDQRLFWVDTLGYMKGLVDKGAQSMFLAKIIDYKRFEAYVGYDREAVFLMMRRMITWFATG
jgi:hypothetical protein